MIAGALSEEGETQKISLQDSLKTFLATMLLAENCFQLAFGACCLMTAAPYHPWLVTAGFLSSQHEEAHLQICGQSVDPSSA